MHINYDHGLKTQVLVQNKDLAWIVFFLEYPVTDQSRESIVAARVRGKQVATIHLPL